jgi:hypothetical protein
MNEHDRWLKRMCQRCRPIVMQYRWTLGRLRVIIYRDWSRWRLFWHPFDLMAGRLRIRWLRY